VIRASRKMRNQKKETLTDQDQIWGPRDQKRGMERPGTQGHSTGHRGCGLELKKTPEGKGRGKKNRGSIRKCMKSGRTRGVLGDRGEVVNDVPWEKKMESCD